MESKERSQDSLRGGEDCRESFFQVSKNSLKSYKGKVGENKNGLWGKSSRRCNGLESREQRRREKEKKVEIKTEILSRRGNCTSLSYPVARAKALLCEGRGCGYFKPSPHSKKSVTLSALSPSFHGTGPGCPKHACPAFLSSSLSSRSIPVPMLCWETQSLFPSLRP